MKIYLSVFLFLVCQVVFAQQGTIFELNQKLGRGINMGNMFEAPTETEWGNPFRNDYFERIADQGFDHVRIPIRWDTPARMQMQSPYTINPGFLVRIKEVVDLALKEDLMVIINMHHHEDLFANPAANKSRFLAQWAQIADYFKDYPEGLVMEVMNEPHAQLTPQLWNEYFSDALGEIRKTNPDRAVLMGTANFGGVAGIFHLDPPDDNNIIVTVHFYSPFTFTHQGADWVGPQSQNWLGTKWNDLEYEREAIRQEIQPVLDFSTAKNIPIHMGEFGAFSTADIQSRGLWTNFLCRYFESVGFSWAYWEWSAGFGVFDPKTNQYNDQLINALLIDPLQEPREAFPIPVYESNFTSSNDGWSFFTQQNAQGNLTREGGFLKTSVQQIGTESWHAQLVRNNVRLEKGKIYRFSFEARAQQALALNYYLGKATDPYNGYSGGGNAVLSTDFKEFTSVFTMSDPTDLQARMVFDLGVAIGTAFFRKVRLEELDLVILSLSQEKMEGIKYYPNPVKERLRIEQIPFGASLELYSPIGQLLRKQDGLESTMELEMGSLVPGIYFLKVSDQNGAAVYRISRQ